MRDILFCLNLISGVKFILHNFQFMAYYDYDPVKQGPYSRGYKKTCNDELSLKTGDFVVVHGEPKANGFYLAEVCWEYHNARNILLINIIFH